MEKVLVAGASGSLGFEVVKKLNKKDVHVRSLVRSEENVKKVKPHSTEVVIADIRHREVLQKVFEGIDVVFSAVGQSISLFSKGSSFYDVDYRFNRILIEEAERAGVQRFVYISIKGSETASAYELAEAHKKVEDLLKLNGMNHTIVRPVGFFSGFIDWLIMGKQGFIPVPGTGEHKTNPIHQSDLAEVVADLIFDGPELVEAGGPQVYTRLEIAHMVAEKTNGKILKVPRLMVEPGLMVLQFVDGDARAKLDYFNFVSTNDMIAPKYGRMLLSDYIAEFDLNLLPYG